MVSLVLFIFFTIILFISSSYNFVYDYKKLCKEVLRDCRYELINVGISSLSSLLAPKEESSNDWVVEINARIDFDEMDKFLTPRPWWTVLEQPNTANTVTSLQQSLVLHRIPFRSMEASRFIANINFPIESSNMTCKSRPAFIYALTGTWGNGILTMLGLYNQFQKAVFVPLTTLTGSKHDRVFLADEHACPDIVNKWECLFLPPTTCPWAHAVMNFDGRGYFSSAIATSVNITKEDMIQRLKLFPDPVINEFVTVGNISASSDPYHITLNTTVRSEYGGGSVLNSHFLYGVTTRFNARFRNLVQQVHGRIQYKLAMECLNKSNDVIGY